MVANNVYTRSYSLVNLAERVGLGVGRVLVYRHEVDAMDGIHAQYITIISVSPCNLVDIALVSLIDL